MHVTRKRVFIVDKRVLATFDLLASLNDQSEARRMEFTKADFRLVSAMQD